MRLKQIVAVLGVYMALMVSSHTAYAQFVEITPIHQDSTTIDTTLKTTEDLENLFSENPDDYYKKYINWLVGDKKYKNAEKIITDRIKQNKGLPQPQLYIDLGNVYNKQGKDAKSKEQFDKVIQMVNGDDMLTQSIVKGFLEINRLDYAVKTYERASEAIMNPYMYAVILAKLYAKNGQLDRSLDILLAGNPGLAANVEGAKAILLEIVGNDPSKLQQVQKVIIAKINEQPENIYFVEILTWIYTQKNDWDGALMQFEAIDERNRETGKRLLEFARSAVNEKQFETAQKAYNDIISKGPELPYYMIAKTEQLSAGLAMLKFNTTFSKIQVDTLCNQYNNFLITYPRYNSAQIAMDYAQVLALYNDNVAKAIDVLQLAVYRPDTRRDDVGKMKLQIGDYYLLMGKIWDASLVYSQVDKEFKQDMMGEDARFRNAKLAYYRGDFDWAQRQLLILKSATSELIANDALYLSVLITENVADSNKLPLQRFAYADLLLAQNKDEAALAILDSIAKAFPKHSLNDDILMVHANVAVKHKDFEKALEYLNHIHAEYGNDVLGDDAVFRMAEIYREDLHNLDNAKQYYEQLIIEYPGSTFVQTARQRLHEINNPVTP